MDLLYYIDLGMTGAVLYHGPIMLTFTCASFNPNTHPLTSLWVVISDFNATAAHLTVNEHEHFSKLALRL
jgi:hypothetical protein